MKTIPYAYHVKLLNANTNCSIFKNLKFKFKHIFLLYLFSFSTVCTLEAQPVKAGAKLLSSATPGYVIGACFVTLPDSTGWSHISVELSDRIKDTVLFYREYIFDQVNGLPSGITWERQGLDVMLGVGTLPRKLGWVGRVKIKSNTGVWSSPSEFLFQ